MVNNIETKRGIFEETEPLKRTVMWGPAGIEAAIAQLLPVDISCFQEQFDVLKAREEFGTVLEIIRRESPSTEVILVKDEYAKLIEASGVQSAKTKEQVLQTFKDKAADYFYRFTQNEPKILRGTREGYADLNLKNDKKNTVELRSEFKEVAKDFYEHLDDPDGEDQLRKVECWIETILEDDIKKYGENTALVLNQELVNGVELPLANDIYARDQSNVLGNTWIWSSMTHKIRQPEVALYRSTLEHIGISTDQNFDVVTTNGHGRFEGGDGIVMNGTAFIGIGGRTNLEGALNAAGSLLDQGLKVIVAYDEGKDKKLENEMKAMHLDTIAMPVSPTELVLCLEEAGKRKAIEITKVGDSLEMEEKGPFIDYLENSGIDIIEIDEYDQAHYAPNFVNIGNKTIILSLDNEKLADKLRSRGYKVIPANMNEITKGYGGLHCSMAPIERGR